MKKVEEKANEKVDEKVKEVVREKVRSKKEKKEKIDEKVKKKRKILIMGVRVRYIRCGQEQCLVMYGKNSLFLAINLSWPP